MLLPLLLFDPDSNILSSWDYLPSPSIRSSVSYLFAARLFILSSSFSFISIPIVPLQDLTTFFSISWLISFYSSILKTFSIYSFSSDFTTLLYFDLPCWNTKVSAAVTDSNALTFWDYAWNCCLPIFTSPFSDLASPYSCSSY